MDFQALCFKLKEIYNLYQNDEIILNKLGNYINNDLPLLLDNTKKNNQERSNRKLLLTSAHNDFVKTFLLKHENTYFYNNTAEIFFIYSNDNISNVKEDKIIYNILSAISETNNNSDEKKDLKQQLIPWKYKIKASILKNVRERNIFDCKTTDNTISLVLSLFQNKFNPIFSSENQVKYFLIILGDHILKKHNSNIYISSFHLRPLIRFLENYGGKYFGHIPVQNSFRYKYHGHKYEDIRLVPINEFKLTEELMDGLGKNILNIFCVAAHLSTIFNSSDEFVKDTKDINLLKYSFFLKNNSQDEIITIFINDKIEETSDCTINIKNMIFLWKCFLRERKLPNIIFMANLKKLLMGQLNYKDDDELFIDYTSSCLPIVSNFIKFWEQNIIENTNEFYLEISELLFLFKSSMGKLSNNMNEDDILNLIRHFYPDIIIDNNKYLISISCAIWDKKKDIIDFFNSIELKDKSDLNELFTQYLEFNKKNSKKNKFPIINKNYFELFLNENLKN